MRAKLLNPVGPSSLLLLLLAVASCQAPPGGETGAARAEGMLAFALDLPLARHDVTAVRFDVLAAGATCDGVPLASKTAPLLPAPAGAGHPYTGGLFVLPPGAYLVCATPLAGELPSQRCSRSEAPATVVADQTNGVALVSACQADGQGGLDVRVALNDPPAITDLQALPSRYITVCDSVTLSVTAADRDGDALTYAWSIKAGPAGGRLRATGATAVFSAPLAGAYQLEVAVEDVFHARAALSLPIDVASAVCAVPAAVQDIFTRGCSPCHTTGTSGRLSLASAEVSYANLLRGAAGAGCMDRQRVVPGDPTTSYLIAKLRNQTPHLRHAHAARSPTPARSRDPGHRDLDRRPAALTAQAGRPGSGRAAETDGRAVGGAGAATTRHLVARRGHALL